MSHYPITSLCPPHTTFSVLPDGGYYRDHFVPSQTHLQTGAQTHLHIYQGYTYIIIHLLGLLQCNPILGNTT